jgi:tRNA threonylcarbamoyladenosine biosynthesis protein TsaB
MYCLFVDIAFGEGVFSLWEEGRVVEERRLPLSESRQPCAVWEELLRKHHLRVEDIEVLSSGIGPGSYTGIRSAISTAKGVAFVRSIPIVPLSSLILFIPCQDGTYTVIADGGIGGIFLQEVERKNGQWIVGGARLTDISELEKRSAKETFISPSVDWIMQKHPNAHLLATATQPHRAHTMAAAEVCIQQFNQGNICSSTTILPLYLRKTQAEIERERHMQGVGNL